MVLRVRRSSLDQQERRRRRQEARAAHIQRVPSNKDVTLAVSFDNFWLWVAARLRLLLRSKRLPLDNEGHHERGGDWQAGRPGAL